MRAVLLPLLVLAGCSDPFKPVTGGALWLIDASDDVFECGLGPVKISDPKGPNVLDGRGYLIGEQMLAVVLRKVKKGAEGPLRDSERFSVPAGREVAAGISGLFDLRFTAAPGGAHGQNVDYRFAWEGGRPVEGRLELPLPGVFAFLAPKGDQRYSLLLVSVAAFD